MAFNAIPTNLFPGYTYVGTDLIIPLADLPGLDATAAHTTTGDNRRIAQALVEQIFSWYDALAEADRPTKLKVAEDVRAESGVSDIRKVIVQQTLDKTSTLANEV
jgi:hypothetical protein